MIVRLFFFYAILFQSNIHCETVHGCTLNNNNRRFISLNKTSVTLSCPNNGYILVRNLTFGVHKLTTKPPTCSYQPGDCTTRTTYIGMECNGLRQCHLDLNPQYLHICSQYSDYMVLDYSCLQGQSLSICDNDLITTSPIDLTHRAFIRSPNYPNEYENSLNCSCQIDTQDARIEFLDFYLEERDETNLCSRDYLQLGNALYCDSKIEPNDQFVPSMMLNSSIDVTFKTNDVITRKGFWFMIQSNQSLRVSCRNSFETPFPSTSFILKETVQSSTSPSNLSISMTHHLSHRYALSFILRFILVFVAVLFILNIILIALCCKQRHSKSSLHSKTSSSSTHRPFFCSKRSSSSSCSSITYGDAPVLTSLDTQKRQATSTTTTTTTTNGSFEDSNEVVLLQRQQKLDHNASLYLQHQFEPKTFCPVIMPSCAMTTGYNRMIHLSSASIHCHLNSANQAFFPLHSHYTTGSQHIYETIQDGHCPYQRLAATLRRQQQQQQHQSTCTCYCTNNEPILSTRTDNNDKDVNVELNPETLV